VPDWKSEAILNWIPGFDSLTRRHKKNIMITKKELAQLKRSLAHFEKTKMKIAALRDKLRDDLEEIECVIESMNEAVEEFEIGKRSFEDGVDRLSQYV